MTTEDMKMAWQETGSGLGSDTDTRQILNEFRNGVPKTSLERLLARYRRFAIFGFVCVPLSLTFTQSDIFPGNYRWIMAGILMAYFLTCGLMDLWLYRGLDKIDIQRMPVSEVLNLAAYYKKKHLLFVCILLPLAFVVMGCYVYFMNDFHELIYGVAFGAAAGLGIGSYQLFRFMSDYKNIA